MDNGGVFLLGLFAFFFVLWVFGGGPQRPISYQGVFITPATSTQSRQVGYGPKPTVDVSVDLPGNSNVVVQTPQRATTTQTTTTTSSSSVSLTRSTKSSSANPNQQYLEFLVTSHDTHEVNVRGWKLTSAAIQNAVIISADQKIEPGQSVLIVTSFPVSDHDTVQLYDASGVAVASMSF